MKNTLIALMLLFGAIPAFAQAPAELKTETIAAVTTRVGSMMEPFAVRPLRGDDRPTSNRALIVKEGEDSGAVLLKVPSNPQQAQFINELLDACLQNGVELTVSGPLVKYTNSFGDTTMLHIRHLEITIRDPNMKMRQKITFDIED